MCDGIEDCELLRLLAAWKPEEANAICRSVVRSLTDYTLDPSEFNKARCRRSRGAVCLDTVDAWRPAARGERIHA